MQTEWQSRRKYLGSARISSCRWGLPANLHPSGPKPAPKDRSATAIGDKVAVEMPRAHNKILKAISYRQFSEFLETVLYCEIRFLNLKSDGAFQSSPATRF